MTSYTDIFAGNQVFPTEVSYRLINLAADVSLAWPLEVNPQQTAAADLIDVVASSGGLSVLMPDATKASVGQSVTFVNKGSNSFAVRTKTGATILSVAPGESWIVYLTNNTTVSGAWGYVAFGTAPVSINPAAISGFGLTSNGVLLNQSMPVVTTSTSATLTPASRASALVWTGATGSLGLTSATTLGNNWFSMVRNSGSGDLTISPPVGEVINGLSSLTLAPSESATIVTDGTSFYTVGYTKSATSAFDYTNVNLGTGGTYSLAPSEFDKVSYRFSGALTANATVVVPSTVQQYWVDNATTGPYTLTVKTAAGTGITVGQGTRSILYSNGTNVVEANSASIMIPVTIAQGGTGASTAAVARTNLNVLSTDDTLALIIALG